jgi:hypothetical protein
LIRHERDNGKWETWDEFKEYMLAKYAATDSAFERFDKLIGLQQKPKESVDAYYQRFDDAIERQKRPMPGDGRHQFNFMFVRSLLPEIKTGVLRLPEAKNLETISLQDTLELATRVEESAKSIANDSSQRASKAGPERHSRKEGSTEGGIDRTKLSPKERRFLDSNVKRGGGLSVFPSVQKKCRCTPSSGHAHREGVCDFSLGSGSQVVNE